MGVFLWEGFFEAKRWVEAKRAYLAFALLTTIPLFWIPQCKPLLTLLYGVAWHLGHAESAGLFWEMIGFPSWLANTLAVGIGTIFAGILCRFGFMFYETDRPNRVTAWIYTRAWVKNLPYPAIVLFGLLLPVGGVVTGIGIALAAQLPKRNAVICILAVNFVKLCGWGHLMARLFPHPHIHL